MLQPAIIHFSHFPGCLTFQIPDSQCLVGASMAFPLVHEAAGGRGFGLLRLMICNLECNIAWMKSEGELYNMFSLHCMVGCDLVIDGQLSQPIPDM